MIDAGENQIMQQMENQINDNKNYTSIKKMEIDEMQDNFFKEKEIINTQLEENA